MSFRRIIAGFPLILGGAVAGGFLYSKRPPEGLGDTFMMAVQGRAEYIVPEVYYIGMALAAASILAGLLALVRGR